MKKRAIVLPVALCAALVVPGGQDQTTVTIEEDNGFRTISSNGVPNHRVGSFTEDDGDAIYVEPQSHRFRVTLEPRVQRRATPVDRGYFGIALNGVPFDGRAEEYWNDRSRSGWAYDTLRNGKALQLDQNNGHAQRGGSYHYHGSPNGLINALGESDKMRLLGWAADGFPIYDQFAHKDPKDPASPLVRIQPSYRVRAGVRPTEPFGTFNGDFVEDWEYEVAFGDLDECNGRTGVTPEFPDGTYYYVITERFPGGPRFFRGTPDNSFSQRRRGR